MNLTDDEIRVLANAASFAIQCDDLEAIDCDSETLESAREKLMAEEFRRDMNTKKAPASKKAK